MNKLPTIIVDNDKKFVDLVKESMKKTDNLLYAGLALNLDELKKICAQFIPSLILINIDLADYEAIKTVNYIKEKYQSVFVVLMNMDGKRFGEYQSVEKIADGYLDKNFLFDEVKKISIFLEDSRKVKDFSVLPEG